MQRLIYCPDSEKLDEASNLSKKLSLPIVVGESESISFIDFDRDSVSVLIVPEKNQIHFIENVNQGLHQSVRYTNEFIDLNSATLRDCDLQILPIIKEKHYCQFIYPCNNVGNRSFSILVGEVVLEERNYSVS
jgi:hypothetical protein